MCQDRGGQVLDQVSEGREGQKQVMKDERQKEVEWRSGDDVFGSHIHSS